MRKFEKNDSISVQAIAGTHVVLLGLDIQQHVTNDLLGFFIERKYKDEDYRALVPNDVPFESNGDDAPVIAEYAMVQAMRWSDYTVLPNASYAYRITAIHGSPGELSEGDSVEVEISTENPEDNTHAIYFNRGVAGSQAYSRRFGKYLRFYPVSKGYGDRARIAPQAFIKPSDVPKRGAYTWLSRGLEEAMFSFIEQASGPEYSLRAAVYEFTYEPVIRAFVAAIERGADVKVVHHSKIKSDFVLKYDRNTSTVSSWKDGTQEDETFNNRYGFKDRVPDAQARAAINTVNELGVTDPAHFDKLQSMLIPRTNTTISHNKFIVLLKDGKPIEVWTGSTNYTEGGIFGQSNVGHVVRDEAVAKDFFDYWECLSENPSSRKTKEWTETQQPDITGEPQKDITTIFSPRPKIGMLDWYAEQMKNARSSVFFTTAFTVADQIFNIVKDARQTSEDQVFLRYLLLEGKGGLLKDKVPVLQNCSQNRLAWGELLKKRRGLDTPNMPHDEALTGLNDHVNFLHTKYMLIDPLSENPTVISGSANFSENSTTKNDENMLIIRGNTRVADIYLTEFMRLFSHFESRNKLNVLSNDDYQKTRGLTPDPSWVEPYFDQGSPLYDERRLFSKIS